MKTKAKNSVQPSLFDYQGPPSKCSARRTDPETSHVAAAEKGKGGVLEIGSADSDRERIYNVIRLRPGLTAGEIAKHFIGCYPHEKFWDNNRVGRRTPELKAAGRINSFGSKICELKNSLMQVYVVTRKPPRFPGDPGEPTCCGDTRNHRWVRIPGTDRETGECQCGVVLGTRKIVEGAK